MKKNKVLSLLLVVFSPLLSDPLIFPSKTKLLEISEKDARESWSFVTCHDTYSGINPEFCTERFKKTFDRSLGILERTLWEAIKSNKIGSGFMDVMENSNGVFACNETMDQTVRINCNSKLTIDSLNKLFEMQQRRIDPSSEEIKILIDKIINEAKAAYQLQVNFHNQEAKKIKCYCSQCDPRYPNQRFNDKIWNKR